ncbi:active regulator of SIRT1-like [Cylas formicarius]|uniref:active regulator of SIRT1-like n=1 Tax=Cylas formicarius TaxID=197179 RepID=UPI002958B281|nr:active regulator of SIRT1-like [Cylas formicarius]
MSASMVRKALELVDPDFGPRKNRKSRGKAAPKYTIVEARKRLKSKGEILEHNLKTLELIKKYSAVRLDRDATERIVDRAVSRRPAATKEDADDSKGTCFTEEDFEKFEKEYQPE